MGAVGGAGSVKRFSFASDANNSAIWSVGSLGAPRLGHDRIIQPLAMVSEVIWPSCSSLTRGCLTGA